MKEFESISPDKELAVHQNVRQKALKAQMQIMRGHILWDYDTATGKLVRAEYESVLDLKSGETVKKVMTKPGHEYFQALNLKNAVKKIAKGL